MTGIRESFIFAMEEDFGEGIPDGGKWIAPPVGSFFNSTHSRQATKIYTVGSKFFDTVAYGQMNGSFNWTFVFDYYYLEPLKLAFESIGVEKIDDTHYAHTFQKRNNMRVPSFTVRRKIMNEMAGGPDHSDEITELRGCVVRNVSFSKAAGTSELRVTMTGFYVDERMYKGDLDATDYKEYEGKLSEYMCMFVGDIDKDNYVANTESLEFSLENNSDAVYNTCSPFAGIYYEGRTNVTFGTTCYSNDPEHYKQRVYSGGYRNDVFKPMSKGLKPIPLVTLAAYDKSVRDDDYLDFTDAIADSDERMIVEIDQVVIKSLTWPKGNDQKLQDTISSAECRNIKLTVVNTKSDDDDYGAAVNPNNIVLGTYGYGVLFVDPLKHEFSPLSAITVKMIGDETKQVVAEFPEIEASEEDNYTFSGWYGSSSGAAGTKYVAGETEITKNITLYARWNAIVTLDGNSGTFPVIGGDPVATKDVTAFVNDLYSTVLGASNTPVREGYTVKEWSTDQLGQKVIDPSINKIPGDITVYAQWTAATYTLSFNPGDGATVDPVQKVITYGQPYGDLPVPVKDGYTFSGWYTAATGGTAITANTVADVGDVTAYAHWTQNNS